MMPRLPMLLLAAAVLAVAGHAFAHGPPAVRDQDVRLLADHNDDCGGDDAGSLGNCHGTHDLVALDLREAHDPVLGDLVYLRLLLNGGSGDLRDVLTLTVAGKATTLELRTSDNQRFTATGFDTAATVSPVVVNGSPDGTRFLVEAGVKLATLGGAGATIADYKVEAYRGQSLGDYMPGGYQNSLGVRTDDPSQGDTRTNFKRTTGYALRGPTYYAALEPARGAVASDGEATVNLRITNQLRNTAQTATLAVAGADGFTAEFAAGAATIDVELGKGGTGTAILRLAGDGHPPAKGTLQVTVTTSLGGRSVHEVPYEITAAGTVPTTAPDEDPDAGPEGAPAAGLALAAGLVLLLAALLRRT